MTGSPTNSPASDQSPLRDFATAIGLTAAGLIVAGLLMLAAGPVSAVAGGLLRPAEALRGRLIVEPHWQPGQPPTWEYRLRRDLPERHERGPLETLALVVTPAAPPGVVGLRFTAAPPEGFLDGAQVEVSGRLEGGQLAVSDDRAPTLLVRASENPDARRFAAVVLVNFEANRAEPWDREQASRVVAALAPTTGRHPVWTTAFDYLTVDYDPNTCDYAGLAAAVSQAAAKAKISLQPYTDLAYAFPRVPCPFDHWTGSAGGREVWLNGNLGLRMPERPAPVPALAAAPVTPSAGLTCDGRSEEPQHPACDYPTRTNLKVALLLVTHADDQVALWGTEQARRALFTGPDSAAAALSEGSGGLVSVEGDVFGWLTIEAPSSTCDSDLMARQAKATAAALGIDLSGYDHLMFAVAPGRDCDWAGRGYLGGSLTWLNGNINPAVMTHELAHNLAFAHASALGCRKGDQPTALALVVGDCQQAAYGDLFSIMNTTTRRHPNNYEMASVGWLPPDDLKTITEPGTYRLGAMDRHRDGAPRVLRIPRPDGTWLYLELRARSGRFDDFAPADPVVNGVSIRLAGDWTLPMSEAALLDASPQTDTFDDAPLAVGQTLLDPSSGVSITVTEIVDGVAVIEAAWSWPDPP